MCETERARQKRANGNNSGRFNGKIDGPRKGTEETSLPDSDPAKVLAPGGALSRVLPGFESRPQQVQMAEAVARVLQEGGVGLIEAGTGTGKSLAYLTPAVLHARQTGQRVIVSTHTHNLQEQLLHDDIPTLQDALGEGDEDPPFDAAVLKGWTNYICLWRLGQVETEQQQLFPEQKRTLEQLHRWAEKGNHDGTLESVDFPVPNDMWQDVYAESDTCLRQRCPFYDDCYYFRARRRAQAADVIIANHHLLCADVAVRQHVGWETEMGVLPRSDYVIFDEAHHLEDVFTQHFGLNFSRTRVQRLLQRVQGKTGLVSRIQRLIAQYPDGDQAQTVATTVAGALPKAVAVVETDAEAFFAHVTQLAASGSNRGQKDSDSDGPVSLARGMVQARFWQPLGGALEQLHTLLLRLAEDLREWQGDSPDIEGAARETEALARRAEAAVADLAALAEPEDGKLVYWLERHGRRRDEWSLRGAPIEIGPVVQEALLENVDAVVMTSATLSAGDEFQYFKQRLGLDGWPRIVDQRRIDSPFDYERQVLLCVADDLPVPEHPSFWKSLAHGLKMWLAASDGRAFVLFTSYRGLDTVWEDMLPWLREQGMTGLRQGEMSRARLLARFRGAKRPVLFGTDSFWEGVDVPGEALSLVVVTRLPFRVPTDPIAIARRDALQERGMDAFAHLTVPQAVMRLRQGFGRLIRTSTDRGAVIIADNRILTRTYGRRFLAALPRTARHRGPVPSLAAAVTKWLG